MHFDLIVIGAGSGGVRAARLAAQDGQRVALIEDGMLGGTCVNLGCIPKKLYVNAGLFDHYRQLAADYGWQIARGSFSLARLQAAKDEEIKRLQSVYRANAEKAGVVIFDGKAGFIGAARVRVGAQQLTAEKFLLATGTRSTMPEDFPGIELAHNSDAVFALDAVPERVLVYGGGYIAVELAGVLGRFGAKVDLVYRGERILKNFDLDLTRALQDMLPYSSVRLHLRTQVQELQQQGDHIVAITNTAKKIKSDFVLFALGRHANIADLGLTGACGSEKGNQLRLTPAGFIQVGDDYHTSIPGIYALGDVIGTPQLTPMAIAQAMDFCAKHYAVAAPAMPRYIPTTVFTHPPLGTVGAQEHQLRAQKCAYHCYSGSFTPLHLVLGQHPEKVHYKILVEQATDLVVGVHMLGDHAGEIMQTMAAAMESGITKTQLDRTLAIHPTIAEELVTSYQPNYSWTPE